VEKVQRRAVGMISGLRGHDYEERLKEMRLTTLDEKRHQAAMLQWSRLNVGEIIFSHLFSSLQSPDVHNRITDAK
jgi:hypothetical protein